MRHLVKQMKTKHEPHERRETQEHKELGVGLERAHCELHAEKGARGRRDKRTPLRNRPWRSLCPRLQRT